MPYCIVLTKEGSSQLISMVPSTWVKDNILFWPRLKKNSELECLRRSENSVPGENWKKIKCKVKVNGIGTFVEGLKLEELYSNFEDTEDEERYKENRESNRRHPTLKSVKDDLLDLNSDFDVNKDHQETITEENKTIMEEKDSNSELQDKIIENYAFENCFFNQNMEASDVTQITTENITTMNPNPVSEHNADNFVTLKLDQLNEIISENSALSTENKILKESIQRYQNLEQETKRGFAVMQIQLDKIFEFMKSTSICNKDETAEANTKKIDDVITQKKITFPLNSKEQLDLLESELTNADFAKALVKKFSKISGTSGTHKIGKIGLQISKSFFTDELLHQFTWKGIKGCSKLPFVPYINIRDCFYKIVHLADNSCSALEADSFLQNSAIKHSGQRIKRKSCERNVSKSKKTKTENKTNTINDNEGSCSSNNTRTIQNLHQEEVETPNSEEEVTKDDCKENENVLIDDDMPDTKKASKVVTVLSDVKIRNKIMDFRQKSKMQNISSDNLRSYFGD